MPTWDNTPPTSKTISGITMSNTAPVSASLINESPPVSIRAIHTAAISSATWGTGARADIGAIDGLTIAAGDIILIVNHEDDSKNGMWIADTFQPVYRRLGSEGEISADGFVSANLRVTAREGTANKGKVYKLDSDIDLEQGVDDQTWEAQAYAGSPIAATLP